MFEGERHPLDELRRGSEMVMELLDSGKIRACEKTIQGDWVVNSWVQRAVLDFFRTHDASFMGIPGTDWCSWCDKIPAKFAQWDAARFSAEKIRVVPGAYVRKSAYIGPGAVLMPSFVNVAARVGAGTMIDTWATVGSCAQVGENCHISGGVGIGGVLEPLGSSPTIIEDRCFIGARSEIVDGVIVGEGSVLAMGTYIGASTKIIDRMTGEVTFGKVPPYSVVVPGCAPTAGGVSTYCAVVVKKVCDRTRSRTSINEILREIY
ncbi:2,3,4,5-tetrahydropyridine-2,6-dicarboxylate N-succinyltransferase [Anaplasma capra]|uniref:2,3,4,5-tetrahydropyridine-2,6-dicarboxylate N-succinyltransferase n=1 Tax=Anaplasma capra TaxID=1562740 RepID=UPI0021D5883D|nr:2,3,4,5-tetrahydropyridine-2,6-dicarboxylate N-succinyltransferase [Anaplasma capra]MCU7611213.1 2,3,4,5-tetrahydropyridine-2,6-dicarboxylate N-succinyltransferase [Anaplasma capra]MCU7612283.1 2,3,4,5-tetrahydropyridine-2,6-dicarboxylate N-succinyltransferase [Anaplasma capra]